MSKNLIDDERYLLAVVFTIVLLVQFYFECSGVLLRNAVDDGSRDTSDLFAGYRLVGLLH